jgi:hypothetical protein
MWRPTKLDFLFYDFSVIYYDFFKDSDEINKKEKDKTAVTVAKPMLLYQNHRPKPLERMIWPVLQSLGGKLDRLIVRG